MKINDMLQQSKIMSGPFPIVDNRQFDNPIMHFIEWFESAYMNEVKEPKSMVISTYDKKYITDSRVMIIKAIDHEGFFIETNKRGAKVDQIAYNQHVAINFYWREQGRQIRIQGLSIQIENFEHVKDYLDAQSRDLAVYKIIPTKAEFYQALNEGGYKRLLYTLKDEQWQTEWL